VGAQASIGATSAAASNFLFIVSSTDIPALPEHGQVSVSALWASEALTRIISDLLLRELDGAADVERGDGADGQSGEATRSLHGFVFGAQLGRHRRHIEHIAGGARPEPGRRST
jgi:hypothetical protein